MRQLLATLFAIGLAAGCSNPIDAPLMEDAGIVSDAAPTDSQIYYGQCDWGSRPNPESIRVPQNGPCTLRVTFDDSTPSIVFRATVWLESDNFQNQRFDLERDPREPEGHYDKMETLRLDWGDFTVWAGLNLDENGRVGFGLDEGTFYMNRTRMGEDRFTF